MSEASPKERALELLELSSGSKNMSVWLQENVISRLSEYYLIKSGFEDEVLRELKSIKPWQVK